MALKKLLVIVVFASILTGLGCVPYWQYYELRSTYDNTLKIHDTIKKVGARLGPENERLKRENAQYKLDLDKANAKLRAIGEKIQNTNFQKLLEGLGREIETRVVTPEIKASKEVTVTSEGKIEILGSLLFSPGKATVRSQARRVLTNIASTLQSPKYANTIIRVEGHTDRTPVVKHKATMENNWKLSALRAYAVIMELKRAGVPESRLCGMFWGENKNKMYNPPGKAVAANRRVEISLIEK